MIDSSDNEKATYLEHRETSVDMTFVYSVPGDTLPSQYRSLKLFPTSNVADLSEPDVNVTKYRPTTRVVYVILVAVFIVSLIFATLVSFIEIQRVLKSPDYSQDQMIFDYSHYFTVEHNASEPVPIVQVIQPGNEDRTSCINTCRPYSQARFQSQCVDGYCVCEGDGYQQLNCLPQIGRCIIRKSMAHVSNTYIDNIPEPVYQCRTKTEGATEIHVIGIHGNHFAKQTIVSINGDRKSPCILVLASHFPVHWKLKSTNLDFRGIYVVSNQKSFESSIDVSTFISNNAMTPEVTKLNIPVGYGDDRHNGNTTEMLRLLTKRFGHINSFTGAAFADYINVKL